jgi:DNA-binding winged helix-turn-helix (wHTH) protein
VSSVAEKGPRLIYSSKGWEIDFALRELRSAGVPVSIGSRAFEILEILARSGGKLVGKYQLMEQVWPGAIVEENTLQFHISAIRKALGADRDLLKTVSGRGYQLVGDWESSEAIELQHQSGSADAKPKRPFGTNLPIPASPLIGRDALCRILVEILSAYRVVTLTGPGGSERAFWLKRSGARFLRPVGATAGSSSWPPYSTLLSCRRPFRLPWD